MAENIITELIQYVEEQKILTPDQMTKFRSYPSFLALPIAKQYLNVYRGREDESIPILMKLLSDEGINPKVKRSHLVKLIDSYDKIYKFYQMTPFDFRVYAFI